MTVQVGHWVRREQRRVAHLVESVVMGDAITRCGRRMTDEPNTRGHLLLADHDPLRCLHCVTTIELTGGN